MRNKFWLLLLVLSSVAFSQSPSTGIKKSGAGYSVSFKDGSSVPYGEPTTMSDSLATKLGLKVYAHGTTYNGSAPTITLTAGGGSLTAINNGTFVPRQMQNGSWRVEFNFQAQVSSASRTVAAFTLSGVTFTGNAAVSCSMGNGGALIPSNGGIYDTAAFVCYSPSQTTQEYYVSGIVPMASKPAWAY